MNAINYCAISFNNKIFNLNIKLNELNFTNIAISNAKKIEFKLKILFYHIHVQHDNQKLWYRKTTV